MYIFEFLYLVRLIIITVFISFSYLGIKAIYLEKSFRKDEKLAWYMMVIVFNFLGVVLYYMYKRLIDKQNKT